MEPRPLSQQRGAGSTLGGACRFAARTAAALALALLAACAAPSQKDGAAPSDADARADARADTRAGHRTLHPGGEAPSMRLVSGPDLGGLTPGRLFPAPNLDARMRFIEAIDQCGRSADVGVQTDARVLRELLESSADEQEFLRQLAERFTAWESVPADARAKPTEGLVTGYATPVVRATRRAEGRFRYPLFVDLRRRFPQVADAPRRQILSTPGVDTQAIAWVSDPLAWALIETNGSARLLFEDGVEPKELCISRVSTNGRPWTGMGRWFAANGLIDKPDYTLADVRTTAYVHPEKAEMAALDNERVVYFNLVDPRRFPTALGLPGARLIAGWSAAADQSIYPPGSILLLVEETEGQRVAHLLFVHDAGGAIAGPQRVDCYLGEGDAALSRAGDLRGAARVYRLRVATGAE